MVNFERKYALIELWSYFIDILAPGVGILLCFIRPGDWSFALKSCPRGGDFDKKLVARQSARGGMVTGQIDTCINGKPDEIKIFPNWQQ